MSKPWITIIHKDGTKVVLDWESVKEGFKSMFRTEDQE